MKILFVVHPTDRTDPIVESIRNDVEGMIAVGQATAVYCPLGPWQGVFRRLGAEVVTFNGADDEISAVAETIAFERTSILCFPDPFLMPARGLHDKTGCPIYISIHKEDVAEYSPESWDAFSGIFCRTPRTKDALLAIRPDLKERAEVSIETSSKESALHPKISPRPIKTNEKKIAVFLRCAHQLRTFLSNLPEVHSLVCHQLKKNVRWSIYGPEEVQNSFITGLDQQNGVINHHFCGNAIDPDVHVSNIFQEFDLVVANGHDAVEALKLGVPTLLYIGEGELKSVSKSDFWELSNGGFGYSCGKPNSSKFDIDRLSENILMALSNTKDAIDLSSITASYTSQNLWSSKKLNFMDKAFGPRAHGSVAQPYMPVEETELVIKTYAEANVILEYGSGGSTEIACLMPNKLVFSVESDIEWSRTLRKSLSNPIFLSRGTVFHVDIGATGPWGRPLDDRNWRNYPQYPLAIWDQTWFRHPDVILIDGRFRTACFVTALLQCKRPTTVLFDDYSVRERYREVERIVAPNQIVGRMAEFKISPNMIPQEHYRWSIDQFFIASIHGMTRAQYKSEGKTGPHSAKLRKIASRP